MIKNFIDKNFYEYYEDISLKPYNTYRLNTKCKYLIFPKNIEELIDLLKYLKSNNYKYLILGNGSNVIFKSDYYDGVIIRLDKLNKVTIENNIVEAYAGVSLSKLSMDISLKGLAGLEFACGIPGHVGASVAMNAGAYNSSMSDIIIDAKIINSNLELITMTKEELEFSYRDSFLKRNKDYIVVSARFELKNSNSKELLETISTRRVRRLETQPLNYPSAGSVFRNPEGMHAGELIEKCNLKGYQVGGAVVSQKHANFIINNGKATGEDIVKLINIIQEKIYKKYNIKLIKEQIIIE